MSFARDFLPGTHLRTAEGSCILLIHSTDLGRQTGVARSSAGNASGLNGPDNENAAAISPDAITI